MMTRTSHWFHRIAAPLSALTLAFGLGTAQAAPPLYTFGPDANGVGREFTQLPSGDAAAFGSGSVAFNGGLVYGLGSFYAIGNDSAGGSSLYSFGTDLVLSTGTSVGVGFYGGLGLKGATSTLYGISSDFTGYGSLYSFGTDGSAVTLIGGLGYGFYGGATYNSDDGYLYALSDATGSGAQRELQKIDVSTGAVTSLFALGSDDSVSFNGGLTYDSATDTFYVIGNDAFGSTLYHFDLTGASSLAAEGGSFGAGFVNAGLAIGPDINVTSPVPEPSTVLLMAAGLGLLVVARRRR